MHNVSQVCPCCSMYQNSISFQAKSYFIVYIYNICFIHSFDDGYLGCFHFLATVNAMYIALNICFGSCFQFLGYIHRSGIAESCNSSFWGTAILFPIVAALAYHPICNVHQSHWYFIKKKSLSLLHMHTHTHTHMQFLCQAFTEHVLFANARWVKKKYVLSNILWTTTKCPHNTKQRLVILKLKFHVNWFV